MPEFTAPALGNRNNTVTRDVGTDTGASESSDVGTDRGSTVSRDYHERHPFKSDGKIGSVKVALK